MATDPHSGFGPIVAAHGFTFPEETQNIGATIGSACHEAIGTFLQARIDGLAFDIASTLTVAKTKFRKLTENNLPSDRETPDARTAEKQIESAILAYWDHALTLKPKRVEFELKTRLDPHKPYILSGHPDILEMNGSIRDMKFGKNLSPYEAQLGAYRLMARSHGIDTGSLFVDWVKRTSIKKPQTPLEIVEYDPSLAETTAYHAIDDAVRQLEKFRETGDPWSFGANPNSKLCSKKWCPAWGTDFCHLGRPDKTAEGD